MLWLRLAVLALMPYCYTSSYWHCRRDWPVVETAVDYIVVFQGSQDTKVAFFKRDVNGHQQLQDWESYNWTGQLPGKSLDGKWRFTYAHTAARCYRIVISNECLDVLAEDFNWGPSAGMPEPPSPGVCYGLPRALFRGVAHAMSKKTNEESIWPRF